jgi:hypothetical protein
MSKRSAAFAVGLALTAGLAACATPTPYQPNVPGQAASGGFSEVRLEPNRWRVTFTGNSLTSRETVEAYLLFRAAELTVQNGEDWFAIVDRHTERDARLQSYGYSPWYPYPYWRPYWRYYGHGFGWRTWDPFWGDPFWGDQVDVRLVQKFEASAEIVMGKGPKPADDPKAFDAHAVIQNLQPRIQYPAPRS